MKVYLEEGTAEMVLWGTIVNAVAIIAGGFLGVLLPRIPEGIRNTVMQGMGLAVSVLGIMMVIKSQHFLILILSLVLGGIIGGLLRLEQRLEALGNWLEQMIGPRGKGSVAAGFVTATLIYCIGAMAILGAIDSGMRHNFDILYTKSMLDGFSAIIFASTLGIGVVFSAVPVFLYEGVIALASTFIFMFISQDMLNAMIAEISAVGGILIIGVGLNVLEIKKINVANLLPSLLIAAAALPFTSWVSHFFS